MRRLVALPVLAALASACASVPPAVTPPVAAAPTVTIDSTVTVALLQINDVYEITPIEGGRYGGMARVATIRQRLLAETPHVVTFLAGDFYSPSALGTARVNGQRLQGRQMVAVLNALGLDLATFGNHEFDLSEADFRARVAESRFRYVSANVLDATTMEPFRNVPLDTTYTFASRFGPVRVGFTGVTLPATVKPYVAYTDAFTALGLAESRLNDRRPAAKVAITHQTLAEDLAVASRMGGGGQYDLVVGGHEHENILLMRGPHLTPLAKADANVRTVYVHRLRIHPRLGLLRIDHELVPVDASVPDDPAVAAEVQRWVDAGYAGFRADGFEPTAVVTTLPIPLDGREASVRNTVTPLTGLIAEAYFRDAAQDGAVDAAVYNSGSIRVDDVLPAGPMTEYDVIRVLPFGGFVQTAEVRGATLDSVLAAGVGNVGSGGFLQTHQIGGGPGAWTVNGQPLDPRRTYRIATSDFLVSGREANLGFFAPRNPNVKVVATHRDVRRAMIVELRRRYGTP